MNLFEQHRKQRIAAFLASMAVASFGVVGAADTSNVATENATYVDITINNIREDTGLELGTGARARGNGSIATGTNSLAIGKNAVATGGNENKDTITNKLNENKQRLQEIQTAQETTDRLMKEVQDIRKQQADVIEAGERVKQVRKSKATAKTAWDTALKEYNDAVASSTADIQAAQAKIDDFNSRLTAVSRIPNVDISSEEGITRAATQFKQLVEDGTTLNTDISFYKNYIVNYYKAEGDLRQAYVTDSTTLYQAKIGINNYAIKQYIYNDVHNLAFDYLITYGNPSTNMNKNASLYNGTSDDWELGMDSGHKDYVGTYVDDFNNIKSNRFMPSNSNNISDVTSSTTLYGLPNINVNTDIASKDGYDKTLAYWQKIWDAVPDAVARYKSPLITESDKENMKKWTYQNLLQYKAKLNTVYYQWKYEQTHDLTWLDKKKAVSGQLNKELIQYTPTETYRDMVTRYSSQLNAIYKQWKKENITDVEDKNKITVSKLTSELAAALNVNKDAVQQIQNKLASLKQQADKAKQTYENINPSAADLALAANYDKVMRDLLNKSNSLKAEQERLEALKKALTLNDLTNVGENAIAVGTDSLSTGTNSIAVGTNAIATGENSIAIGKGSAVTGTDSIAIGTGHIVIGDNSGTFGDPNTIYADNSYAIGNNNTIGSSATPHTVGTNTFVLGNNVTTTANNAVILGAGSVGKDNTVSVGKPGAERQIINVAAGTLSSTSTDAVNGSQLYATNQSISNLENAIKNSSAKDILAVHYDKKGPSITLGKQMERPYIIVRTEAPTAVSDKVDPSSPSGRVSVDDPNRLSESEKEAVNGFMMLAAIPSGTNRDDDGVYKVYLDDDGHVMNPPHLTNGTVPDWAKEKYDIPRSWNEDGSFEGVELDYKILETKIGDLTSADTTLYITDPTPIKITNLADGAIDKNSSDAINGSQLYTALAGKADKDASNITGVDKTKWQETLGDGKAEAGNKGLVNGDTLNTELSKKADKTDITNINADLANKANKDASNITGTDKTKWQEALGDGKAEAGNKGLVNGDTLNTELNKKSNTDLSNITKEGQTVIQNLAKGSVKVVAGTNTTVTKGTDGDATTYAVNVSADAIKGAVQGDLDSKANKDASNLSTTDVTKWQETLGNGKAEAGNKGLINGDTLNTELNKKADKTDITNINADLANKANKDASNITGTDKTKWQETLGDGKAEAGNKGLVTGDTLNTELNKKADKTDIININADLANKANTDASNISIDDAKKWAEKLGTGTITKGDTSLVTGDTVYNTTINKANTDMDNLTDTGKTVIQNLAKDSVKVIAGTNTTVTTGKDGDATTYAVNVSKDDIKAAVQSDLDAKANRDASNLTAMDIKSWQDALSHDGKVEAGNTSLITGDTVYNVVKNIELSAEKLVTTDGQTTYIDKNGTSTTIDVSHVGKDGKSEGRVIQGVVTDVDNPTSVVTVSTMSNALENLNANVGSQINALDRKLTKDVKHAGAIAAALAALNPLPYDASNKLNFAVGQGRYRGENATALGVFYQPNEDISISLGGTISSGDKAMNAGVSFRVGSGNAAKKTVKQSEFDALKAENKAMAERLDALQKQIEGLKAIKLATADRKPFPDVPENHWAAEAIETLHANDVVEGYEDGEFKGDKTMTRYEYAQMLYKAAHKA